MKQKLDIFLRLDRSQTGLQFKTKKKALIDFPNNVNVESLFKHLLSGKKGVRIQVDSNPLHPIYLISPNYNNYSVVQLLLLPLPVVHPNDSLCEQKHLLHDDDDGSCAITRNGP